MPLKKTPSPLAPVSGRSIKRRLLVGSLLCLLALFALFFLCHCSRKHLYTENDSFLLTEVQIPEVDDELQKQILQVLGKCGVRLQESYLPKIPLEDIRKNLEDNPRIKEARVRRIFPGTLLIETLPRVPVAILRFHPSSGMHELLIDREGMVLPRDVPAPTKTLPTIRGIQSPKDFKVGARCTDKGILAFLTFLKESQIRPEGSMYEILNVSLDPKNNCMTLNLEAQGVFRPGTRMVMPMDNVASEMDRVKVVVELRAAANESISYIDASYVNIPVRP